MSWDVMIYNTQGRVPPPIAGPLGWSALDCSTNEFIDLGNPSQEGWQGFQAFRDKIVRPTKGKKPK